MNQPPVNSNPPNPYLTYNPRDRKITIFVVEDSAIYRELISSFIYTMDRSYLSPEESEFEIRSFSTGEQCMGNLDENTDIVILDYFLDGYQNHPDCIDGMETLKQIKRRSPKTHVIVVSSNRDMTLAKNFIHHGASDYVSKELGVREKLQHAVSRIVRLVRRERGDENSGDG